MTDWRIEPLSPDHERTSFACGILSLDDFIRFRVTQYEGRKLGRTYVAVPTNGKMVSGYYTISASQVAFDSMPPDLGRKLPKHPIPTVLIGRLAVAKASQGQRLGEILLLDSLRRAAQFSVGLGIHAVQVDAVDERAASFYRRYGFVPLLDQPHRLFLPIRTIAP